MELFQKSLLLDDGKGKGKRMTKFFKVVNSESDDFIIITDMNKCLVIDDSLEEVENNVRLEEYEEMPEYDEESEEIIKSNIECSYSDLFDFSELNKPYYTLIEISS